MRFTAAIMKPSPRRSSSDGDHPSIHPITSSNTPGGIITSPARKHRRQSSPARLWVPRPEEHGSDGGCNRSTDDTRPVPAAAAAQKVEDSSSTWNIPQHLTKGRKAFYSRVGKICDIVSTHPLPVRVNLVSGHGEFFDRGDPIPKHATLTVSGVEDPLVECLELEKLLSAALSERARRRNDQMEAFMSRALGDNDVACITEVTCGGDCSGRGKRHDNEREKSDKRWWSLLCANKRLTEDENFKRVRDGEPLGTVADGVEWALLEKIRSQDGKHTSGVCGFASATVDAAACCGLSRSQDDVAVSVKVARLWAGCLAWGVVSRGEWSYPGIMTRILKQDMRIPQVEILINMQTPREEGKTTVKGTCSGSGTRSKGTVSETRRSAEGWRWRASRTSDCAAGEDEVLLWSKDAINLSANLADVFKEEGIEEATRKAAAATARRTEVMARCYAILRVALQDIVEGKASTCMLEGENDAAVTESYLLWLEKTATRKVKADWAQRKEDVSQVISCIKLSIKRQLKVSKAVPVWFKEHFPATSAAAAATAAGDEIRGGSCKFRSEPSSSSLSSSPLLEAETGEGPAGGGPVPTEREFSALKRKEAKQAQDTDTVAVIMHHALYLVLPCQPFSFHFTWGRFMRFYHETHLNEHISKYYTEDFRTGRTWFHSDFGGSWIAPAIGLEESTSSADLGHDAASGESNNFSSDANGSSDGGNGRGSRGESSTPALRPVSRQVARNLVKPMHPPTLALPSPFTHVFPPADHSAGNVQPQQGGGALERDGVATGGVILTQIGHGGSEEVVSTLSSAEAAVANECLVALLAMHGTANRLATCAQVTAALKREGFPDAEASLALLKDVHALRGRGVTDRLWRKRRGAALVRARVEDSVLARLPFDLFRNVLMFLAS